MIVIGRGTDPNTNNESTIAFDKVFLEGHDKTWPKGATDPKGIKEIRDRIVAYEAQHGVVDPQAVSDKHDADQASNLAALTAFAASMGFK